MKHLRIFTISLILLLTVSETVYSGTTGKIAGFIKDKDTGNPLPGAAVVVKGTFRGAATDLNGYYFISNVSPGEYTLAISMMGYKRVELTKVKVTTDLTTQISYDMEPTVLQSDETVVVEARRKLIDPSITTKSTVISAREIETLPITDTKQILNMQGGIIEVMGYNNKIPGFESRGIDQTHVRGGRNGEIAYMIDGMYVEDAIYAGMGTTINREAIQEMKIEIGGFSAEYGEAQAAMVNIVTKEGSKNIKMSLESSTSGWGGIGGKDNPISKSDDLRDFHEVLGSLSGPLPFLNNSSFFFAGSQKFKRNQVYEFDDITYNDMEVVDLLSDLENESNLEVYKELNRQIDEGIISKYSSVEEMAENNVVVGDVLKTDAYGDYRLAHEFDTFAGWKSFGFNEEWDVLGKLVFRPLSSMKVMFTDRFTNRRFRSYERPFQYNMQGQHIRNKATDEQNLTLTHQISPKSFYELKAYRIWLEQTSYVYGPNGERLGPSAGAFAEVDGEIFDLHNPYSPEYPIRSSTGGFWRPLEYSTTVRLDENQDSVYNDNGELIYDNVYSERIIFFDEFGNIIPFRDYGKTTAFRSDTISVPVFTGSASQYWTRTYQQTRGYKASFQSQVTKEHEIKAGIEFRTYDIRFSELQFPWISNPYGERYTRHPNESSFYLLDNMSFNRININLGGRIDYANSKGRFFEDPTDPTSNLLTGKDKYQLSPRLGIGFPITDRTTLRFNYGQFFQVPEYRNLYAGSTVDFNAPSPLFGNPHLQAQKTVNFEISIKQLFLDDWTIELTPWQRDQTGQTGTIGIVGFDTLDLGSYKYSTFLNRDHATSKGFDVVINKSLSNQWFGSMNYTWSKATTNQYYSWSGYWNSITAENDPQKEFPAAYDQTHVLTLNLGMQTLKNGGIKLGGWTPLENSLVNLVFNMASGLPYTPRVGSREAEPNSARKPTSLQLDGMFRKDFVFGKDTRFSIYARVINLFDRLNALSVFSATGSADLPDRGAAGTTTLFNRPYFYGPRRAIDIGFRLSF